MDWVVFVGSKGGVGTSTVAVPHALSIAESGACVRSMTDPRRRIGGSIDSGGEEGACSGGPLRRAHPRGGCTAQEEP